MKEIFQGKKILITGGTGSIGRLLTKECLNYGPEVIRILANDENALFKLQFELKNHSMNSKVRFLLGDIRDKERFKRAMKGIDIIYHTAALKQVISCEYNPFEAVKTNIIGVQNLIDNAIEENVEKVIFTSSDKAVNPTNAMGASKLMAEKLITSANFAGGTHDTIFSCTRFGNVLGTSSSLIPIIENQVRKGNDVTLTDERMTRFIMSPKKSTELIFKTTKIALGGEIFIFKMPTVVIKDLIEVLIEIFARSYSKEPSDIKIKTIGTQPGEKLYEELMTEDEATRAFEINDLYLILPTLKDLYEIDEKRYNFPLKSAKISSYNSKDQVQLNKDEIHSILKEFINV